MLEAVRRRVSLPARSDTPTWLRVGAAAVVTLAVVLGVVLGWSGRAVNGDVAVVGYRTAPHVAATEDLALALSDMDEKLANLMLVGVDPAFGAETRGDWQQTFGERRHQAAADLQQAAEMASSDDPTQLAIREIINQLSQYNSYAEQAVRLNEIEHGPAGTTSKEALDAYRRAAVVMANLQHMTADLTASNNAVLTAAYQNIRQTASATMITLGIVGGALVVVLLWIQWWLRVVTRRRVNVGLAAATVVAILLTGGGIATLRTVSHHLRVAKVEAFDSLMPLWSARAISYQTNADESRWLLDVEQRDAVERTYFASSQELMHLDVRDLAAYQAKAPEVVARHLAEHKPVTFAGRLGDELRNITFPGEQIAADQMMQAYVQYQLDDRILRDMARTNLHDAVLFNAKTNDPGSDFDFILYDNKIAAVIDINQRQFDQAIAAAEKALAGWTGVLPYGGVLFIVALLWVGVRARLGEYR